MKRRSFLVLLFLGVLSVFTGLGLANMRPAQVLKFALDIELRKYGLSVEDEIMISYCQNFSEVFGISRLKALAYLLVVCSPGLFEEYYRRLTQGFVVRFFLSTNYIQNQSRYISEYYGFYDPYIAPCTLLKK